MTYASCQTAEHAVRLHRAKPESFAACIRAVRLLQDGGFPEEALTVADGFATARGGGALAGDTITDIVRTAPVQTFSPGQPLLLEGTHGDQVWVILRGTVTVRRVGSGDVARLGPGECVGEIAAMVGTARTASVYATARTEALALARGDLARMAQLLPPVAEMLRADARARMLGTMMRPGTAFSDLDPEQKAALFARFVPLTVGEGTKVLKQSQPGAGLCVIVSGRAEVWREERGERRYLAKLGPGDVFGEMSLIYEQPVSANVEALTPLTFCALRPADFRAFLQAFPDAGRRFVRLADERGGRATAKSIHISAEHRVLTAGPRMNVVERASFSTHANVGGRCPVCGYADAEIVCISCGAVQ